MNKYLKQYKWANVKAMMKNNKKDPKECNEDFTDRRVVITGATSGIGYSTTKEYAKHGANLLIINRNEEKSKKLCDEIRNEFNVECDYLIADFSRLADVHDVTDSLLKSEIEIDVLIHNAGVYNTKKKFTDDDIEEVFQVDHLGAFIITYGLREKLKSEGKARIILVNSEGHRFAMLGVHLDDLRWDKHRYTGLKSYGSAKTAQLLTMLIFDQYFHGSGVTINAMHPGDVKTNMGENNGKSYRFFKHKFINRKARDPEISAVSLYYLGVSKELDGISGKFFNLTTEEIPAPPALDEEVAHELWKRSIEMSGL